MKSIVLNIYFWALYINIHEINGTPSKVCIFIAKVCILIDKVCIFIDKVCMVLQASLGTDPSLTWHCAQGTWVCAQVAWQCAQGA